MTRLSQTNASKTDASANELSGSHEQNTSQEVEYLLKLVASLEACNMALLSKLTQVERELATLKESTKASAPETDRAGHHHQAYGWERKLARKQWRAA